MLRGIRPDYWICAVGAQVEDAAGTALYTSHMTAEEMYALVDFCEDYEHPLGFSFSDGGYVYLIMRPSMCRRKPLHWKVA